MESTSAGPRRFDVSALARRYGSDARRVERVLAAARVGLSCACLFAAIVGGSLPLENLTVVRWVLATYVAQSLIIFLLIEVSGGFGRSTPLAVHVSDFAFATTVTAVTGGPASPFLVTFLFFVLASAYRWRLRATVWSAAAALVAVAVQWWLVDGRALDLDRFVLHIAVTAMLLGFLVEDERRQRLELGVSGDLLATIQAQAGFRSALRHVCRELIALTEASGIVVAAREIDSSREVIWSVTPSAGHPLLLTSSDRAEPGDEPYFFDAQGDAWSIVRRRGDTCTLAALSRDRTALRPLKCDLNSEFWRRHPAEAAAVISVSFGSEWRGRVFVLRHRRFAVSELRFLHRVVCHVVPAMHGQYLVRRLRSRAGAAERRRVARELHDSVVQSLFGLELQAAALRRQVGARDADVDAHLQRMQHRLAEEERAVREVMHQIRPMELGARELVPAMSDIVERFARENGLHAEFESSESTVPLAPRVARELVRTLQEALTNVRKHAAARHVRVRLSEDGDMWRLTIANDGRPFPFTGRLDIHELDTRKLGPRVIKERIREMGADLTIESSPDGGVVLEISIPRSDQGSRRRA